METILASLGELARIHEGGFLLRYGNAQGVDIDVLAVTSLEADVALDLPPLDALVLGRERMRAAVLDYDLRVTEPLQSGVLILGSSEELRAARALVANLEFTSIVRRRLAWRSIELLRMTPDLGTVGPKRSVDTDRRILTNLSYALSFRVMAVTTAEGERGVPRLSRLMAESTLLAEVRLAIHRLKVERSSVDLDLQQLTQRLENAVLGCGKF